MDKRDFTALFNALHPNFFESAHIRALPEEYVFEEMILPLDEFDPSVYERRLDGVSFGFYGGGLDELRAAVAKVDGDWLQYFNETDCVFCGLVEGKIASFCHIYDMGEHSVNGRNLKIGVPGCVGTVPEYRNKGIGLTMVKCATQILKDEGCDISYIHYTGVAQWYAKLGYRTAIRWNRKGIKD
ncbi:MAG: GNAT family N-acetyltransferase [Lachnospiraceae bacterium]|nr:GNAT family N-acetyltransferase [Ruminococcus sp.]MCM1274612.1 GNAT family N-acetyltransferase [Lachnospiraceae bacterium]